MPEAEAKQQRPLALKNLERSGLNVPDAIQVGGTVWRYPCGILHQTKLHPGVGRAGTACSLQVCFMHVIALPAFLPLPQVPVACTEDVLEVMDRGQRNRAVAETRMNDRSSRSHQVGVWREWG